MGAFAMALMIAAAACNRAEPGASVAASGKLSAEELELLAHLPKGGFAVFGGNAFALQRWVYESQLAGMLVKREPVETVMWNRCLAEKATATAGTLAMEADAPVLRIYARGLTLEVLEQCAGDSLLTGARDADGRGFTVELKHHDGTKEMLPLLAVEGGSYLRQALPDLRALLGYRKVVQPTTRAELEADVAGLAQGTAASDGRLTALLGKVDRKQTLWFASYTEGTSAADTLKNVQGSLSFTKGISAEIMAQSAKAGAADGLVKQYRQGMEQLRRASEELKPLKDVMGRISLKEADDALRISFTLDHEQVAMLLMAASAGRR